MLSTWTSATAVLRRLGVALMLTAIVVLTTAGLANAQAAAQQAPAAAPAQAAPAPQARVFTGDLGLMFNVIKPDKTADFEMVVGKLKEAFAKSDDPVHKQMAQGWRVVKNPEPIAGRQLPVRLPDRPGRQGCRLHGVARPRQGVSGRGAGTLQGVQRVLRRRRDAAELRHRREHEVIRRRAVPPGRGVPSRGRPIRVSGRSGRRPDVEVR